VIAALALAFEHDDAREAGKLEGGAGPRDPAADHEDINLVLTRQIGRMASFAHAVGACSRTALGAETVGVITRVGYRRMQPRPEARLPRNLHMQVMNLQTEFFAVLISDFQMGRILS
jgi:hypothetical protein